MDNILEIEIDSDIILDESRISGMPYDIKGNLLATMTHACEEYECHWTELTWSVKIHSGQPVIYVKKRK